MPDKKIIVSAKQLADIHNVLFMMHPTGEDIISIANCVMSLRQIVDNAPEYVEEAENAPECKEEEEAKND